MRTLDKSYSKGYRPSIDLVYVWCTPLRFKWTGKWRGGEIELEAETLDELNSNIDRLISTNLSEPPSDSATSDFPVVPRETGCSEAIRKSLESDWGTITPRSMVEITQVLEANGLYFTKGTLSGTLTLMTQRGDIRRSKKNDKWVYTINSTRLEK
jgi:hypothetical protein